MRGNIKINEVLHEGLYLILQKTSEASSPSRPTRVTSPGSKHLCNILEALEINLISRTWRTTLQSTDVQKSSQPNHALMENLSCCRHTSVSLHLRPKAVKRAKRVPDLYILLQAKVLINPTEQYLASCLSHLPFATLQVTLLSHTHGRSGLWAQTRAALHVHEYHFQCDWAHPAFADRKIFKIGNKNRRYSIKVAFLPEFHPHIARVWVNIRFKQLIECWICQWQIGSMHSLKHPGVCRAIIWERQGRKTKETFNLWVYF